MAPHTAPRAATALHKLARRLTKAHMLRLGEHPYQLHRHLDSLQDWLHPSRGGGGGAPLHSRCGWAAAVAAAVTVQRVRGAEGVQRARSPARRQPNATVLLPLGSLPHRCRRIMVSGAVYLGQHVDSGLFNIVVGTAADVAPIHLHLGGERKREQASGVGQSSVC